MKHVLFAPAAGRDVGGGHVMRCLTLAQALASRGATCTFAVNEAGAALMRRFGDGFDLHRQGAASALRREAFEAVVIDDYSSDEDEEAAFRRSAPALIVIDDLANRRHGADLLVDPGYGRLPSDYDGLLPDAAIRLTGPAYALVRPAFAELRSTALTQPIVEAPRRLFLSFGLSDIGAIALRTVTTVRARHSDIVIDVALALDAESAPALRASAETDTGLRLHFNALNVAGLMAGADAAIGAGGASTWERACLGLPTLAVIVADNQRGVIGAMEKDGALLATDLSDGDFDRAFAEKLQTLWSPQVRADLRIRSAGLCDGQGAARVADAILAL